MAFRAVHAAEAKAEYERLEQILAAVEQVHGEDSLLVAGMYPQVRAAEQAMWAAEAEHRQVASQGPGECRCSKHLALADEFERWSHEQWLEWLADREAGVR